MDYHMDEAIRMLQQHRTSQAEERSSTCLSRKPTEGVYTYKEVNHCLSQVVDRDGPAGLASALLSLGGDVNFSRQKSSNLWKTICGKGQQPKRNDLLLRAVIHCPPDVLHALAGHADQMNLDGVLHHAIVRADLDVLRVLLARGADPSEFHDDFENAVFRNELELVEVLLTGPKQPCLPCRSSGLRIAVKNQSPEVLRLLLESGANVNHDGAVALLKAVEAGRPDFVAILISGHVRASPSSLDAAVGETYTVMAGKDTKEGREIIELSISAGARGQETTRLFTKGLVEVVRRRQFRLMDTILKFSKPTGEFETLAILEAIKANQRSVLDKFLKLNPSPLSLAAAVTQAMKLDESASRYETVRVLISSGATGDSVASAFVVTVQMITRSHHQIDEQTQDVDRRLFDLLLNEGKANVNYGRGEALQHAVRASSMDIVGQIVSKNPSPDSLGAALPLVMSLQDQQRKQEFVQMLLRHKITDDAVNQSMVEAVKAGPRNTRLVELLLTRASVDYNTGEAFTCAIRNLDLEMLRLLLSRKPNFKAVGTAVAEALRVAKADRPIVISTLLKYLHRDHLDWAFKEVGTEPQPDLELVKTLLQAGANVTFEDGVCIRHAARNLDIDAILILANFSGHNETIFTAALSDVVSDGTGWIAWEHLDVINVLVSHGASSKVLDKALVEVVSHLAGSDSQAELAEQLLDVLLGAGADVNSENGKSAGLAASRGDAFMLRRLLGQGATVETASFAFSAAILAHHKERCLLALIEVFMDDGTTVPDVNTPLPGMPAPVFLCLNSYFGSDKLVDRLVAIGCNLETTVSRKIFSDEARNDAGSIAAADFAEEPVSVLMWALLQPEDKISSSVVAALIANGANIDYLTPKTRVTPLILAAKYGRTSVVEQLLEFGVKVSAKDVLGRSAVFYASRSGNVDVVGLLLRGKPSVNDGSLQEASRGFHGPAMALLINAGHEANYRSTKHGGRTALAEMALRGRVPRDISAAEDALEILNGAGADPLSQVYGKSIIFLALDNSDPQPVTGLLLEKILWRNINDDANVFQEGSYHYSPTMYVSKKMDQSPNATSLLELLRNHGATDRYYTSADQLQPRDAVGLPPQIQDLERERRARHLQLQLEEEAHQAALRREAEQATHRARLAEAQHSTTLRHRGQEHTQDVQIEAEKHHHRAHVLLSEAGTRSQINWVHHRDREDMTAETRDNDIMHRGRVHGLFLTEQGELEEMELGRRDRSTEQELMHEDARFQLKARYLEMDNVNRVRQDGRVKGLEHAHTVAMNNEALRLLEIGNSAKVETTRALEASRIGAQREMLRDEWLQLRARDRITAESEARALGGKRAEHAMKMLEKHGDVWGGATGFVEPEERSAQIGAGRRQGAIGPPRRA